MDSSCPGVGGMPVSLACFLLFGCKVQGANETNARRRVRGKTVAPPATHSSASSSSAFFSALVRVSASAASLPAAALMPARFLACCSGEGRRGEEALDRECERKARGRGKKKK